MQDTYVYTLVCFDYFESPKRHEHHVIVIQAVVAPLRPSALLLLQPASQSAGWYRPTAYTVPLTDLRSLLQKCRPTCTHFWNNVIIFVTTTPAHICQSKYLGQHMACTWSSRVCVQNFAVVRRGVQEEMPQTK